MRIALAGRALVGALDVAVAPGECVTVMGPRGCGKSTLLAFIAGTLDPAFARDGRRARSATATSRRCRRSARRVGILFQDDLLFPHLSVGDNLAFALPRVVRDRATRRAADRAGARRSRTSRASTTATRRRSPAASARASR